MRRSLIFRFYVMAALMPCITLLPGRGAVAQERRPATERTVVITNPRLKGLDARDVERTGAPPAGTEADAAAPVSAPTGGLRSPSALTPEEESLPTRLLLRRRLPVKPIVAVVPARPLIISEFRLNGTNGANDEFIEIYNASNSAHTVASSDGTGGYGLAASDGVVRFFIPNNTVIPARGHYLACNSVGYSLTTYPSGNDGAVATTAECDVTYTQNITNGEDPDGAGGNPPLPRQGIALFSTANANTFSLANRLDAVGPSEELNTLYKEGTGVRNLSHFSTAHSYVRRLPGGCIGTDPDTVDANCTSLASIQNTALATSGYNQDTDNNRDDFIFVDTNGTDQNTEGGEQRRLGAPGPENLTSPIVRTHPTGAGVINPSLVDPCVSYDLSPNTLRDSTSDPEEPNDSFGSLFIRRKFTNHTGASITRLRFRIMDITVFPSGAFVLPQGSTCGDPGTECAADLRALSSLAVVVTISPACGGGTATVQGTTLEQAAPAEHQPSGGGFNSTMSAGTVTLSTPLANLASINLNFRFGVQQQGKFRVFVVVEALP